MTSPQLNDYHGSAPIEGIGFTSLYGNSYMHDLLNSSMPKIVRSADEAAPLRVVLIGACDVRHIFATLAGRNRRVDGGRRIEFYVYESSLEVIGRSALLLALLCDSGLSVRERTETFLSIYGNSLIRDRDEKWMSDSSKLLINVLTESGSSHLVDFLNFKSLRFQERDLLLEIFSFYKSGVFDCEKLRDQRLRGFYKNRFEVRKNLLDWNFQFCLKKVIPHIHWEEYKSFGLTGVAFETRLANNRIPNRSLASFTEANQRGQRMLVRGFWGDIVNSPFICFAKDVVCEDSRARLLKKIGDQYRHSATEIAEFNIFALLHECVTGNSFSLPAEKPEENKFPYPSPLDTIKAPGVVVEEIDDENDKKILSDESFCPTDGLPKSFENATVNFLSGDLGTALKKIPCDIEVCFIGSLASGFLLGAPVITEPSPFGSLEPVQAQPSIASGILKSRMRSGGTVLVESLQAQVLLDDKTKRNFRQKVDEAATDLGWKTAEQKDGSELEMPDIIRFTSF